MFKWLVLILIVVAIYLTIQKGKARQSDAADSRRRSATPERMVVCAHCGVYLPLSECVGEPGVATFCCEEHRRLGPKRPS